MTTQKSIAWMVKSGGQMIGPYTERQVVDLLRDRVIVPLDEISEPCERWRHIRDVPLFSKAVEEIRVRSIRGTSDDTITQNDDDMEGTQTITEGPALDDLTEDLKIPRAQTVQDIMFQSIDDLRTPVSRQSSEAFTHEHDRFVKQSVQKTSRWIWAATVVFILATVSYVAFKKFVSTPIENRNLVEEKMTAGINSLESGDYDLALSNFKSAHELAPAEESIFLYLGILKIQIEDQPFQGRKLLERLLGRDDKDMKRILTGIGLAYLHEGDASAAEASFNRALDVDLLFRPALINLGAAALSKEEWAKASNHLQLALKEGSADGSEVVMLVEALTQLFKKEKDRRYLADASSYIEDYLAKSTNYQFEILIAKAFVSSLLSDNAAVYAAVDKLLDADAHETEAHRQNLFINRRKAGWGLVSQWCLQMTHDLDPNARVMAFEALCLMKGGDVVEASRRVDDAMAQAPKDPLVLATFAQVLMATNAVERARSAIEKAIAESEPSRLQQAIRLKAQMCQASNDQACQSRYWSMLVERNPRSLEALAGLARVQLNSGDIDGAKKYLMKGLQISANYKPFFPINRAISLNEDRDKARGL